MDSILNFLKYPEQNNEEGYNKLYGFFCKVASKFEIQDILDEYHTFLSKKIFSNNALKRFIDKNEKEQVVYGYIKRMINNYFYNEYRNDLATIPIDNPISEDGELTIGDTIKDEFLADEIIFEAFSLLNLIDNGFSEKKKKILCQYLYAGEYIFINDMKQDAFYKSVERLKKELTEICISNKFSEEAVTFFIQNIYLSEICEKYRLIGRGQNE